MSANTSIYVRLCLMSLFWSVGMVCGRILGEIIHAPATLSAIRFLMAAVVMLVVAPWRGLPEKFSWRNRIGLITISFASAAFSYFYFLGIAEVNAVGTALVIALNPVLVALGAAFVMHERLGRLRWIGVLFSFAGGLVVVSGGDMANIISPGKGTLYLLGCTVSWTIYSLVGKLVLDRFPVLFAVWIGMIVGALMLLLLAAFTEPMHEVLRMPLEGWLALLFIGVFVSAISYLFYYQGINALGVGRAANFINLVPVFTALLAWLTLGEVPYHSQLIGGAIVLLGLWLVNHPSAGAVGNGR